MFQKVFVLVVAALLLISCSTTRTQTDREESARPRVEQRALSTAMDEAFTKVDFTVLKGKRVFVECHALSKTDVGFITAYINSRMVEHGGIPVAKIEDAEMKILNIVKVSGTDEITRRILSDKVRGEYKSTFTVINLMAKSIIKTYELTAEADEYR